MSNDLKSNRSVVCSSKYYRSVAVRRAVMLLSLLAASSLLVGRAAAAVEVVETTSLPGWCVPLFRVGGERGSVNLAEVRAECAWLERQFPRLQARVFVLPQPVQTWSPWWEEAGCQGLVRRHSAARPNSAA